MTLFVLSVSLAVGISFLCSTMEATLLSLSPSQLVQLQNKHPKMGAIWQKFKQKIDTPLTVILVINTAANTIGAMFAGTQFEKVFGNEWMGIFSLVFTYVILQFSEILPKSIGVRYNSTIAIYMAYPILFFSKLMLPIICFIRMVNYPFSKGGNAVAIDMVEEISALAGQARLTDQLSQQQERIIQETADLNESTIREIMVDVDQIVFLSSDMTLDDALIVAHLDPHTRFPVCENADKDRILGYVNFKELIYHMRTNPKDNSLRGIIRPVFLAHPDQTADEVTRIFVDRHEHMAIVRDDDGKTVGLVTLEDVIEVLLGKELGDEFDKPPTMLHNLSNGVWMVGGGIPVSRLSKRLQFDLPCNDQEGTILSDFLIEKFGKMPSVGDTLKIGDFHFSIRRMRREKIFEVSVYDPEDTPSPHQS